MNKFFIFCNFNCTDCENIPKIFLKENTFYGINFESEKVFIFFSLSEH